MLNREGLRTARCQTFTSALVWILRKRWGIATVNPACNPRHWPDGSYSVQGAAAVLGVYPGTIFQWLRRGRLHGQQIAKGLAWRIALSEERTAALRAYVAQVRRPRRRAS